MDKYAIIQTGGKQYKVKQGDTIQIEKLEVSEGDKITFDEVLLVGSEDETKVGTPYVEGATVEGTSLGNGKGEKVIIFKFKAKKDYRKKNGHRQPFTAVTIDAINL